MKIQINYVPSENLYYAEVWDGPDRIDHEDFLCSSLGEAFEEIVKFRMKVALQYYDVRDEK